MTALELDAIVAAHDLNEHPFYRAWRAGTLPSEKLAAYAAAYAPFIGAIEQGWRTLGYEGHANEERQHARMWAAFRDAVGPSGEPVCPEATALVEEAHRLFADPAEALGALYAFEAQQPSTSRSKLAGLREHYAVGEAAEAYFRVHADDYGEREELGRLADTLGDAEGERARAACECSCRAMWSALTGILSECVAGC